MDLTAPKIGVISTALRSGSRLSASRIAPKTMRTQLPNPRP